MSIDDVLPEEWDRVKWAKNGPLAHLNDNMTPPQADKEDVVNRPHHYNTGSIEAIDAIKESMNPQDFKGYLKGNIMKYMWRYEYKNGVEDLRKAQWYLKRLIEENLE